MTTKAYSNDLRLRVIEHIKSGNTQKTTSLLFKVSKSAVGKWWLRYIQEGSTISRFRGGSKGKVNPVQLEQYVASNPDKTLKEIGATFGVSDCAIHKRLRSLGIKYKKKTFNILKLVKKKEKVI